MLTQPKHLPTLPLNPSSTLISPPEGKRTAFFLAAMLSRVWTYTPGSVTSVLFCTKSQYWLSPSVLDLALLHVRGTRPLSPQQVTFK